MTNLTARMCEEALWLERTISLPDGNSVLKKLCLLHVGESRLDAGRFHCFTKEACAFPVRIGGVMHMQSPEPVASVNAIWEHEDMMEELIPKAISWIGENIESPWSMLSLQVPIFRVINNDIHMLDLLFSVVFSFSDDAEAGDFAVRFA